MSAERRLSDFSEHAVANVALESVTVKEQKEQHSTAMERAEEWRLREFNVQSIANTAWAFATLKLRDEQLFGALARVAE